MEELKIDEGREIPCESKCYVDGDTCVTIVDCCKDLSEKPKNYVYAIKCNGKLYKSQCGEAKPFNCNCECSVDRFICVARVDCCKCNDGIVIKFFKGLLVNVLFLRGTNN